MKVTKMVVFFACLLLSFPALSQEVEYSGDLSTMWGITAPWTENKGDFSVGKIDFTSSLKAYYEESSVFVEGTICYDNVKSTQENTSEITFDLNEAYIDYSTSFWGVRIGSQKTAWGKADGVNITNSVFPCDLSSLFLEDEKLSINAVRLSLSGESKNIPVNLDAFWIPFFKGNKLPVDATITNPELNIKNGEYGIKLSGYFSLCDLSIYGFYGWEKNPLFSLSQEKGFSGEYKRLTMFGFDAAIPIKATVLRFESAFFPKRYFKTSTEAILQGENSSIRQNNLMSLVGLDWMPGDWTFTAQYYCDLLFEKSDKTERTEKYEHAATLSISRTFLSETLELSLSGILGLNDFDSAFELKGDYNLSNQIKISLGSYLFFEGKEIGSYGAYKDSSTIYIKAEYKF